ncbi:MAG: hypothetical protein ACRCSG_05970 [Cellulosilyticaceae bacterium]
MKHKKLIVFVTAIILILSSIGIYGNTLLFSMIKGEVQTVIAFNFKGIDEGLNPHGGTFDIQKFKNDTVLEQTIADLELDKKGITKEILSNSIGIRAYVPKDVLDRIMPQVKDDKNTQTTELDGQMYNPTQFVVTLDKTKDFKLGRKDMEAVMERLCINYRADFINRYADTGAFEMGIQPIDIERYDYAEYIQLAEGQLKIMKQYLLAKEQAGRTFKAEETGIGFSDLIARVELLQDIDIKNVNAIVDTFVVTNDQKELQSVYENRIVTLTREGDQLKRDKDVVNNVLKSYSKDPIVVLENGNIISNTKESESEVEELPMYDMLVKQAIELESKINVVSYQINYYKELIAKIMTNTQSNDISKIYEEEVKETINLINEQLQILKSDIIETTDAFYVEDAFKECVEIVAPIRYITAFKMAFIKNTFYIGVITLFGLIAGIILALAKELFGKKTQNA